MDDKVSLKQHKAFEQLPKGDEWLVIKTNGQNLYGVFQLTSETSERWGISLPHKSLVITISSGAYNKSQNLLGDRIVFPDDLLATGKLLLGHFTTRLNYLTDFAPGQTYYVVVSMGSMFSNILPVRL